MPDQVIELSVNETNQLRAKLGLAPLRTAAESSSAAQAISDGTQQQKASSVINLSVNETNDLRQKLGLKPLKTKENFVHRPAENPEAAKEAAERIEQAMLKRKVAKGMADMIAARPSLADESKNEDAAAWARRLQKKSKKSKKASKAVNSETTTANDPKNDATGYEESDLQGLHVAHDVSELQENSTTVLTLADTSLLKEDSDSKKALGLATDEAMLENVNLRDSQVQQDGLKKKRELEMGMGRAGGYAGYDDDEFEELGGTLGPSRTSRGRGALQHSNASEKSKRRPRGFEIGANLEESAAKEESDLFSTKAISLLPTSADVQASDFMTPEEEEAARAKSKKKKKSDKGFSKKKKKSKKIKVRTTTEDDDGDEKPSLLKDLQKTAAVAVTKTRKRRRTDDDDDDDEMGTPLAIAKTEGSIAADKRAKYNAVMEKGNQRTKALFVSKPTAKQEDSGDEEADDAFLNAALAKARRLNRLKELTKKSGADAVAMSLHSQKEETKPDAAPSSSSTIAFAVDETREFTRALQAREAQKTRVKNEPVKEVNKVESVARIKVETAQEEKEDHQSDDDMDMEELAKEVKQDDDELPSAGVEGGTGTEQNLGRGIAGMLGLLQSTGELSRKNAGKEEMRGRARDKRTYEDYDDLDLSQVVKLDERNATEKDKEMARKQIKLEYRDKHGRLLTRRDAFRDLSQQFHGFKGSANKRKEERKLKQIAAEQNQVAAATRQAGEGGILGALRATQQATGKAFVVHKT